MVDSTNELFFSYICCLYIIIFKKSQAFPNIAEYLYNILTHKKYIEREMPILFVLNKQDLPNALKQNFIQAEIIKEMYSFFI